MSFGQIDSRTADTTNKTDEFPRFRPAPRLLPDYHQPYQRCPYKSYECQNYIKVQTYITPKNYKYHVGNNTA